MKLPTLISLLIILISVSCCKRTQTSEDCELRVETKDDGYQTKIFSDSSATTIVLSMDEGHQRSTDFVVPYEWNKPHESIAGQVNCGSDSLIIFALFRPVFLYGNATVLMDIIVLDVRTFEPINKSLSIDLIQIETEEYESPSFSLDYSFVKSNNQMILVVETQKIRFNYPIQLN